MVGQRNWRCLIGGIRGVRGRSRRDGQLMGEGKGGMMEGLVGSLPGGCVVCGYGLLLSCATG